MKTAEIYETLTEVFHEIFYDDSIVILPETTAADIAAWDSLEHINLINEIESRFEMKFKMKEITKMKDVAEMVEIISERTAL